MMVIDSAWGAAPPESLTVLTNRPYAVNPVRFWRGLGPWAIFVLIGALMSNWRGPLRRQWLLVSSVCVLLNGLTAFLYFGPLAKIMLASDAGGRGHAELALLLNRWVIGSWWRLALVIGAFVAAVQALAVDRHSERYGER
jgi:hypothetical protein